MKLRGRKAILRKEDHRLIVEAFPRPYLLSVLASLKPLDELFPAIEPLPAEPIEL